MGKSKSKKKKCIGDKQYNFSPRSRHVQARTMLLNKQWDEKYYSSKITIPTSLQMSFNMMFTYSQHAKIKYSQNVQRHEIPHMNDVFVGLKNSNIDSDMTFYEDFTTAIGRKQFYVKGFLT